MVFRERELDIIEKEAGITEWGGAAGSYIYTT